MGTQGFGALAPQPVGPSGQLGKEQTLEDAEDLFSQYRVGFGRSDSTPHAGTCSVGVDCLNTIKSSTAVPLNQFQRLLGKMAVAVTPLGPLHMRLPQHWPHGRVPRWAWQHGTGSESHRSATKPSPHGQTFRFFGECPWKRSPGMLWFTRMPPPPAGRPCSTGLPCRGFGRVPNCTGTSTA